MDWVPLDLFEAVPREMHRVSPLERRDAEELRAVGCSRTPIVDAVEEVTLSLGRRLLESYGRHRHSVGQVGSKDLLLYAPHIPLLAQVEGQALVAYGQEKH
jgi:hypothetical protein